MILGELIGVAWSSLLHNKLRSPLDHAGRHHWRCCSDCDDLDQRRHRGDYFRGHQPVGIKPGLHFWINDAGGPGQGSQGGGLKMDDVTAIRERISGVDGVTVDQQTTRQSNTAM